MKKTTTVTAAAKAPLIIKGKRLSAKGPQPPACGGFIH